MTITRKHLSPRMSQAVVHGGTVYLSGMVADDADADITVQTQQVLAKIDRHLAEVGSDKSRLLSAQIWLADMADFDAMNAVWEPWVDPANPPTRATGEVRLADRRLKVEVIITAAIKG